MGAATISISIDQQSLSQIDRLVMNKVFKNRGQTVKEKINCMGHDRLARECSKLDPQFEQSLAEEGFSGELKEWPVY